jgi:tetratricopeptide (TPR) repeat protein
MAEHEADAGVRSLLLEEAAGAFSKLAAAANDSCLSALGQAMVAAAGGDLARKQAALARAFEAYPGDSHLPAVHEWLLGKLHAAASGQRRVVAELMPLAISYCMDGWGESAMREIMQRVHAEWEVPSFMTSRGRFAAGDRACHAEAKLFFGFWSARPEVIERALAELSSSERFRPHHLADATFSLIATGHAERAREVLAGAERTLRHDCDLKRERAAILSRSAVLAAAGDLEEADSLLSSVPPDPSDRVYNSARLLHASACFQRGEYARTFKRLRPLGPQERFSREHLAWFYLQLGDAAAAEKQLAPLLERNDHRTGKTLCNFLNGVALILRGREEEALRVFSHLPGVPWPRTWTLGSHYALGRLGNGSLEAYVRGAFPFERKTLATHAELLARARGEPPESLPPALSAP